MKSLFIFAFMFLNSAISASAQSTKAWTGKCVGVGNASDVATIRGFECLFYNFLQIIVYVAGITFFFMLINGGFKYLFSSNDQKKLAAASSTLTMSIIGLVGIIISFFILRFITEFTGVNVINFKIGS